MDHMDGQPGPPRNLPSSQRPNSGQGQVHARAQGDWPELSDDKGESFWNLPQPDRQSLWGARMNLAAAMGEFDERMIPEER